MSEKRERRGAVDLASTSRDSDRLGNEPESPPEGRLLQTGLVPRAASGTKVRQDAFERLYDLAPVGYLALDPKGIIYQANRLASELLGRPKHQLIHLAFSQFICDEDRARYFETLERVCTTGCPPRHGGELRLEPREGKYFYVHFQVASLQYSRAPAGWLVVFTDIDERRRERALLQENLILNGINRILQEALVCQTSEELGGLCLEVAEKTTGSRCGFIGEINNEGILDTLAISRGGQIACRLDSAGGHRWLGAGPEVHGLCSRVLLNGKGFFSNSPASHPESIGVPDGHPPLQAFLGVPLLDGDVVMGLVALANREGGYTDNDRQTLEAITPAMVQAFKYKRAEDALRHSEQRYRALIDASSQAIFRMSPDFKEMRELHGGSFIADTKQPNRDWMSDYIHPDDASSLQEVIDSAVRSGNVVELEHRVRRADGTLGWVFSRAVPMRNAAGEIEEWFGAASDVTQRKLAEQAVKKSRDELELRVRQRTAELQESNQALRREIAQRERMEKDLREAEERFREVLETSLHVSYRRDLKTDRYDYISPRILELCGYEPDEIHAMSTEEILALIHADDRQRVEQMLAEATQLGKERTKLEYRFKHKDGSYRWLSHLLAVVKDEEGNPVYQVGSILDSTEQKTAEKALQISERRLRLLSAKLLVSQEEERKRISLEVHDSISSSLSAIKIGLENLLEQVGGNREDSRVIESLLLLTRQTMEEARRIMSALRPSILDDLGLIPAIDSFCRSFQRLHKDILIEQRIDIQEGDLPENLKIIIYRIMQEALHNVAKHSRADFVALSLGRRSAAFELTIEDNGGGFDLDAVLAREDAERGLGLTSMRERAEFSGGTCTIESSPGHGTIIRASWPV